MIIRNFCLLISFWLLESICFSDGRFVSEHDAILTVQHNYGVSTHDFRDCGVYNFYFGNSELKEQCLTSDVRSFIQENSHLPNAYYRMKVIFEFLDKKQTFFTFLPFNQLVQSNFHYSFKISLDDNLWPLALTATVQNGPTNSMFTDSSYVDVFLQQMSQGPQPDTATFIHKMEKEREAKEKGANQDNRSFLAKYWIYILPLLIFAVLSGSINAEGGNQR